MKLARCARVLAASLLTLWIVPRAGAIAYSFLDVADTSSTYTAFAGPTLNINGDVAFRGNLGGGVFGIYKTNGASLSEITRTDTSVYRTYSPASINNAGSVSFQAAKDPSGLTDAIVLYNSAGLTEIATGNAAGGPAASFAFFDNTIGTSISSGGAAGSGLVGGRVVFMATMGDFSTNALYRGSGVGNRVVDSSSGGGSFDNYASWQINGAGTTVFSATKSGVQGIYMTTQGTGALTTIATGAFTSATINETGTVAFGNINGIFTKNIGAGTVSFVNNSGAYSTFSGPVINNAGSIAFYAQLDNGTFGIYTGPNPVTDKVIEKGASLFGSTVTSLGGSAFNDNGQLAFQVGLANGQTAIVRATPIVAPAGTHSAPVAPTDSTQSAGFTVTTSTGKAAVIAEPGNASNGVIDMTDYVGAGGVNVNKTMAVGSTLRVQFDYKFITSSTLALKLGSATLATIPAPASGAGKDTFAHVDQTFALSTFGLAAGDLAYSFALTGDNGDLYLDNIVLTAPEPTLFGFLGLGGLLARLRLRRPSGLMSRSAAPALIRARQLLLPAASDLRSPGISLVDHGAAGDCDARSFSLTRML